MGLAHSTALHPALPGTCMPPGLLWAIFKFKFRQSLASARKDSTKSLTFEKLMGEMQVLAGPDETRAFSRRCRGAGKRIALVPTMVLLYQLTLIFLP